MKLNLTNLKRSPGVHFPIDWSAQHDHILHRGRSLALCEPIALTGKAYFQDGVVLVDYEMETAVEAECSRCLEGVCSPIHIRESIELIEEPEGGLDSALVNKFSFPHGTKELDLLPYIERIISSSLNPKPLCKLDCKGICASCGQNLNEGACVCNTEKEVDPRLGKLKELLRQ